MLGHSHALSGAVTGAATGIFLHMSEPRTVALAGFTAGMALLPDLDKCGSSPARCLGFLSEAVAKVIASAAANAQNNNGLDPSTLVVATVYADDGPTAKRIRPRAQGRAFRIRRRTSHITVVVESRPSNDARGSQSASATRARRAQASKAAAGNAPAKKAPAKKAAAAKAPAKKATAEKAPAKKASPKKTTEAKASAAKSAGTEATSDAKGGSH